jgi:heme-degrading monooxygenase HmoA
MSVIVMLRIDADPKKFEEVAAQNPDRMRAIADRAVGRGVIAHRFLGNEASGQVMVVDEWESAEQFQAFFEDQNPEIGAMMADVGATSQPSPEFWRVLESHDKIGWDELSR